VSSAFSVDIMSRIHGLTDVERCNSVEKLITDIDNARRRKPRSVWLIDIY
jgi:hypothetical protein